MAENPVDDIQCDKKVSDISTELNKIINFDKPCDIKAILTIGVCDYYNTKYNINFNGKYIYIGQQPKTTLTDDYASFIDRYNFVIDCEVNEDVQLPKTGDDSLWFYNFEQKLTLIIYMQGEEGYGGYTISNACDGNTIIDDNELSFINDGNRYDKSEATIFNQFVIEFIKDTPGKINVLELVSEIEKVSYLCAGICDSDNRGILNIEVDSNYNNNPIYLNKNFNGKYNYIGKQTGPGNDMYDYIYEKYGNICGDQVQLQNQTKKKRNVTENIVKESNENGAEVPDVPNESYWFYNVENNMILTIYITNPDPAAYNYYKGYVFYDLCSYNEILVDDDLSYLCNLEERYGINEKTIFNKFNINADNRNKICNITQDKLSKVILPIYKHVNIINGVIPARFRKKISIAVCEQFQCRAGPGPVCGHIDLNGEYELIGKEPGINALSGTDIDNKIYDEIKKNIGCVRDPVLYLDKDNITNLSLDDSKYATLIFFNKTNRISLEIGFSISDNKVVNYLIWCVNCNFIRVCLSSSRRSDVDFPIEVGTIFSKFEEEELLGVDNGKKSKCYVKYICGQPVIVNGNCGEKSYTLKNCGCKS